MGGWAALAASPLAWPYAAAISALDRVGATPDAIPEVARLDAALGPLAGVRFVPSPPRPRLRGRAAALRGRRYDERIASAGEVATRAGSLHDFANALVWATFPSAKRAVHARQDAMIRARLLPDGAQPGARSPEQDAVAMLDEGGVVLLATPSCAEALERAALARDTDGVRRATSRGEALGLVFGHALLEHVATEDARLVWAQATVIAVPEPRAAALADVDAQLAVRTADRARFTAPKKCGSVSLDPGVLGEPPPARPMALR